MKEKSLSSRLSQIFNPSTWTKEAFVEHELVKKGLGVNPGSYRGGGSFFEFINNGNVSHFLWTNANSSLKAYAECPPVAAIINRKAQAYINGKTWVLNSKEKEGDTLDAKKIKGLMKRPNPIQTGKQFEAQGYIFQQLYGYNIVLAVRSFGFEAIDATALWNITPFCRITLKSFNSLYTISGIKDLIERVDFTYNGVSTPLPVEHLFFMTDIVPSFNTVAFPESKLQSLEGPINNIIGAFESRSVLINSRGPMFLISSDEKDASGSLPITPKEKVALQEEFKQRYGLARGQSTAIISNANVKLSTVGFATKELMLLEEVTESAKSICDVLNYPAHLLGLIDPTFNNQNAAEKGLYQNSIIPDAESNYEQWDKFFELEKLGLTISKDFAHIAVLQQDKAQEATARKTLNEALELEWKNGIITLNRWLELLGENPIGTLGDVRITDIKNSNVPLAVTIGVGGVQSLISILTAQGMSDDAKRNTVEIVFGIATTDAARMVISQPSNQNSQNGNGSQ